MPQYGLMHNCICFHYRAPLCESRGVDDLGLMYKGIPTAIICILPRERLQAARRTEERARG